jgi:glycosyltransferase involved in cell wall biosynthesis
MIYYLNIESYQARYTDSLTYWTTSRLKARNIPFVCVEGITVSDGIKVGRVLDARGRGIYGLTQMTKLIELSQYFQDGDVIYLDDMFTPGYEAIPYLLDQLNVKVSIVARNYAQSVDIDDFTFGMRRWMRPFEQMVSNSAQTILVGSTCHKELMQVAMLECPTHVVGLPFDKYAVLRLAGDLPLWKYKPKQVIFSSRFDAEKQPHFFMDVVEQVLSIDSSVQFCICTGASSLRSNDPTALTRLESLAATGSIRVHENLTKEAYYRTLKNSRVQFNCAKQDFISFTAIEASTLGVPTLAAAYKSFPETLFNNHKQLYIPWSVESAVQQILYLLDNEQDAEVVKRVSDYNHECLDRIIDIIEGYTV